MARVLYGVHGTARGHAIRALTVARHYSMHDFLFVCHGEAARLLGGQFRVFECPNPVTPVSGHRVEVGAAVLRAACTLAAAPHWTRTVRRAAEGFHADVAISDYEFFVPRVARALGVPSLSLCNEHAMTMGRMAFPLAQTANWAGTALSVRLLFSAADQYIIPTFYRVEPRVPRAWVRWVPPLLRDEVVGLEPRTGDHVVAYQGHPTFTRFVEVLEQIGRPVHVYGMDGRDGGGRVSFRRFDERAFLEDLASCAYVICGSGHTVISEALYLGKPVLALPVHGLFEQYLSAFYLDRCGYGMHSSPATFSLDEVRAFEGALDEYRDRLRGHDFCGNPAIFAAIDDFIAGRWRREGRQPPPAA